MIKVNDVTVESHEVEWGLEMMDDITGEHFIAEMDSEADARECARICGETLKVRHVYITEWADAT